MLTILIGETNYDRMLRAVDDCHLHLLADIEALPDPMARLRAYIWVATNEAPEAQLSKIRRRGERNAARMLRAGMRRAKDHIEARMAAQRPIAKGLEGPPA